MRILRREHREPLPPPKDVPLNLVRFFLEVSFLQRTRVSLSGVETGRERCRSTTTNSGTTSSGSVGRLSHTSCLPSPYPPFPLADPPDLLFTAFSLVGAPSSQFNLNQSFPPSTRIGTKVMCAHQTYDPYHAVSKIHESESTKPYLFSTPELTISAR